DYVTHSVPSVTETEGGQVTLDSNYATTLSDYCLYWYRQLSEKQPEYILRSCTVLPEHKAAFAQSRFSVELQTSRTSNKLTISQLELSDSAVYYCALSTHSDGCQRPPRTKTLLALCAIKNIWSIIFFESKEEGGMQKTHRIKALEERDIV
uniref:Ig-like domain-containing protein n=1 Tax=Callorhinchus milii TaxID=7868 RepID=A0A4W3ILL6_CALMI